MFQNFKPRLVFLFVSFVTVFSLIFFPVQTFGEPEKNPLADHLKTQGYFQSGEAQIYYEVYGEGEPIILLHGLLGNTSSWGNDKYLEMSKTLLENYQLLVFDLRGHGKSEHFYDPDSYGEKMAGDVLALMDFLEISKAHIFGYSFGVLLASQLLETAPDRLNSVILGGGLWGREGAEEDFSWAFTLADQFDSGQGLGPLLSLLTAERETPYSEEELKKLEESYLENVDLKAISALLRSTSELGIGTDVMKENSVPVLAIMGEFDPNVPFIPEWLNNSKNVKTLLIKGKNHLNAPKDRKFVEGIAEFLRSSGN